MRASAAAAVAVAIVLWAGTARAASLFDSIYRFRTLPTPHFIIYFHQGEDALAGRLAVIAEDTWAALERPLGTKPPRLTHIVLADQAELANGYATPLPRNTIVVTAAWPAGSEFIGFTDDWLRLVFTHEFTHIVHLDRSESWARVVRGVFGRVPVAFPNLFLPTWQIEGLATYEESVITGEGRLHAGDFRAVVTEAARQYQLEPLDRTNGGLTDWPGGTAPYAYGLGFHAYLSEHYGAEKLAVLAEATARRIPYLASPVFKRIYGRSLGDLWRDYERELQARFPPVDPAPDARQLTHHGFIASGPRFTHPTCAGCSFDLLYTVRTPHEFPSLYRMAPDGTNERRAATRYLGSTTAPAWQMVYFDQQEITRFAGLYSDLYSLDLATGSTRRLTADARLLDPDLCLLTQTIVAVRAAPGRRDLVRMKLDARHGTVGPITTLVSQPETQFNAPRLTRDGRMIVAERHRLGHQSEIVTVDTETGAIRVIASDPEIRWATPTWSAEDFAIIAAAARENEPFNLVEIALTDGQQRQITHMTGGATWPELSPDQNTLVFVGYGTDGFNLFSMPYRTPALGTPLDPLVNEPYRPRLVESPLDSLRGEAPAVPPTKSYSPWRTLAPTSWTPIVEIDHTQTRIGAAVGGTDILGYHAYAASASWPIVTPSNAPGAGATPDWQLSYAYARWVPTLFVSASRSTSFFGGPPTDNGLPSTATEHEQEVEAGALLPIVRTRVAQTAVVSLVRAVDDFTFVNETQTIDRTALRGGWSIVSAHTYGYSISPERGIAAGMTGEAVRSALGASGDATTVTADVRIYAPGLASHHVVAIRGAAGASTGDENVRRVFLLGGAGPNPSLLDFGSEALGLLRGFPSDTFAGTHVALANLDYRFPIARPQRGAGTWPLLVHTFHAALFADAGTVWSRRFAAPDFKIDAGVELSVNLVAGFALPFTATIGVARGHDGSGIVPDRTTAYVRVGRAF